MAFSLVALGRAALWLAVAHGAVSTDEDSQGPTARLWHEASNTAAESKVFTSGEGGLKSNSSAEATVEDEKQHPRTETKSEHVTADRTVQSEQISKTEKYEFDKMCHGGSRKEAEEWFEDLAAPLTPEQFFNEYWTKKPLVLTSGGNGNFSHVFSLDDLEELLDHNNNDNNAPGSGGRRLPPGESIPIGHVEIAKTKPGFGRLRPPKWQEEGKKTGAIQPGAAVYRKAYTNGWSIVINKLYAFWEPVYQVVAQAERYFELPTSGNLYITPPKEKGFALHFDNVDVFFMQIAGRKRWKIYSPLVPFPLEKDHPSLEDEPRAHENLLLDVVLEPGQVLYVPNGFLHEGEVPPEDSEGSIHLTFSPEAISWYEFLIKTPIGKFSGQPNPPGRSKDKPLPKSMQWTAEWAPAVTHGIALPLRRSTPPMYTKTCGTKEFEKGMLNALVSLSPTTSTAESIKAKLETSLGPDGIASACREFLVKLLPEFISLYEADKSTKRPSKSATRTTQAKSNKSEEVLCLASTVGARVPAFQNTRNPKLVYSTGNGPDVRLRYNYEDDEESMPKTKIPPWAVEPLSAVLHSERNPSGIVLPESAFGKAATSAGSGADEVDKLVAHLLELGILEPPVYKSKKSQRVSNEAESQLPRAEKSAGPQSVQVEDHTGSATTAREHSNQNRPAETESHSSAEQLPTSAPPSQRQDQVVANAPSADADVCQQEQNSKKDHDFFDEKTASFEVDASTSPPIPSSIRALKSLLGTQTEVFLRDIWGGHKWHHFSGAQRRDFTHLWSLGLMEHMIESPGSPPWVYEKDVKLVKNGQTHFTSQQPATWSQIQKGLEEGASLVMNSLHYRHVPLYNLLANLEDALNVWVGVNSYLTPVRKVAFNPHWDPHDFLLLQLEGEKVWTMCEQRNVDLEKYKRGGSGKYNIFTIGDDFGECTNVLLRPGDSLYVPYGTIHYAEALQGDYSLHLTLSLDRHQFSWGTLLSELADPIVHKDGVNSAQTHKSAMSAAMAESPALQRQLPRLEDLRLSLDNRDLPDGFLQDYVSAATKLVRSEVPGSVRGHLQQQLGSSRSVAAALNNLRQMLVMGSLKNLYSCPGSVAFNLRGRFRRVPGIGILLHRESSFLVLAIAGERDSSQHQMPLQWEGGLRFALSSYSDGTAKGEYFEFPDMVKKLNGDRNTATQLIKSLLRACVLEMHFEE